MSNVLKISEAASIALHTMLFLLENENKLMSTRDIASTLQVSEAHLSKVLQRLAKEGMVRSVRGPRGGFRIGQKVSDTSLLQIYELIEGPLDDSRCLFEERVCTGNHCLLGNMLEAVNSQVRKYLSETRLSDLRSTRFFNLVDA